jgi:hypothetical protein
MLKEESFSISTTIGDKGELPGRYRYSLFATTDVYYALKLNRIRAKVDEFTVVCARPDPSWGVDYEPDPEGDFGKTADGDLLEIPELDYNSLPGPPRSEWSKVFYDDLTVGGSSHSYYNDRITAELDVEALKKDGYKYVDIGLTVYGTEDLKSGSHIQASAYGGHDEPVYGYWGGISDLDPEYPGNDSFIIYPLVERLPIERFASDFTIEWGIGYGSNPPAFAEESFTITERTIDIRVTK